MANQTDDLSSNPPNSIDPVTLRRKIKLKGQALRLIRGEQEGLKYCLSLLRLRESLLKQMGEEFDPLLSQKLDCIDFLLRN